MKWENVGEPVGFGVALAAMESDSGRVFQSEAGSAAYSVCNGKLCFLVGSHWSEIFHHVNDLVDYMSVQWQEVKQAAEPVSWEVARKDMVENGSTYIAVGELGFYSFDKDGTLLRCGAESRIPYNRAVSSKWIKQ